MPIHFTSLPAFNHGVFCAVLFDSRLHWIKTLVLITIWTSAVYVSLKKGVSSMNPPLSMCLYNRPKRLRTYDKSCLCCTVIPLFMHVRIFLGFPRYPISSCDKEPWTREWKREKRKAIAACSSRLVSREMTWGVRSWTKSLCCFSSWRPKRPRRPQWNVWIVHQTQSYGTRTILDNKNKDQMSEMWREIVRGEVSKHPTVSPLVIKSVLYTATQQQIVWAEAGHGREMDW